MRNPAGSSFPPSGIAVALVALMYGLISSTASADVVVHLDDGRVIHASRVGGETNATKIAVVTQRGRITLTRSFRWATVRSVSIDGRVRHAAEVMREVGTPSAKRIAPAVTNVSSRRSNDATIRTVSHRDHRDRYPLPRKPYAVSEVVPQSGTHTYSGTNKYCRPRGYAPHELYCCPLPMEARVIGVRNDPLATYGDDVERLFPNGVSSGEAGFILDLMRAKKSQELYQATPNAAPNAAPPKPMPPKSKSVLQSKSVLLRRSQPIERIDFRAIPVSSHGLSDWDALDVELVAFGRDGQPIAVRGTVEWTLLGREQSVLRASNLRFVAIPGRVRTLSTWTRSADAPLTPATNSIHSGSRGTSRFRLPLSEPLPAHDLNIADIGELTARVLVPGQGVFVARQRGIPLRHTGFVRDGLVGEYGSLFLPQELTHGRRRAIPHLIGGQSSFRPDHGILSVQP